MKIGETISARLGGCYERWRPVLGVLERELLVFPLAVVLLVTATFWFGGTCSLWHTWGGVAIAFLVAAFDRRVSWRERFRGMALFLFYLALVWVLSGCLVESAFDNNCYRHPVTRLLMCGWNPVYEATPEALSRWGDLSELRPFHVLFISHSCEVFNAAFALFLCESFNIAWPILFFLIPSVGAVIWRLGRDLHFTYVPRCVMVLFAIGMAIRFASVDSAVDILIGLVGIGTVVSMIRIWQGGRDWWVLIGCSLWMITAKQGALLTCFVLWFLFSVLCLLRFRCDWWRWVIKLLFCAIVLGIGLCWICSAPYITSWYHYEHPFYPTYTVDESRYPVYNITGDFLVRNIDAELMGHVGSFINAYGSSFIARKYYAWKTGNPDFMPWCEVWENSGTAQGGAASTAEQRLILLSSIVVILLLGHGIRVIIPFCLLALFCFPAECFGYFRYFPWVAILPGITVGIIINALLYRCHRKWMFIGFSSIFLVIGVFQLLLYPAVLIDQRLELNQVLREPGINAMVLPETRWAWTNFRLLRRQVPEFRGKELLSPDMSDIQTYHLALPMFRVVLNDGPEPAPSLYREASGQPTRLGRYLRYALFVPRTYLVSLPKLMWWRVESLWR